MRDDSLNIRTKTLVEHLVRFIEHQEANLIEPEGILPSRSSIRSGVPTIA
jgi:hypothetical protein